MGLGSDEACVEIGPSFFKSLELVRESFIDTMTFYSLYNSLPLSPFLDYAVSSFRSYSLTLLWTRKRQDLDSLLFC